MYKRIILLSFIITIFFAVKVKSQDDERAMIMFPPAVTNAVYESMTGNWIGESNMMGIPMVQDLKIYWDINHQFIILDMRASGKEDATKVYQGKGLFGIDEMGNAKTWWFDSWGANGVSTSTGAFGDSKLTLNGGNAMYKETRTFLLSGSDMVMSASGTMNMGGKEIPFDETIVFKK